MTPSTLAPLQQRLRQWLSSERMAWLAPLSGWVLLVAIFAGIEQTGLSYTDLHQGIPAETAIFAVSLIVLTALFLVIWRILVFRQNEVCSQARLTDFNALLAQVHQTIAQAENETALLQTLCDLAIRYAHFKLTWVGRPDSEGTIHVLAAAGVTGYLEGMCLSVRPDIPEGQGAAGRTWRDEKPFYNASFERNPVMQPAIEQARRFELGSSAAFPVYRYKTLWAVLAVYHEEEVIFDGDLQAIMEELAKVIGYGLERIDLRHQERYATGLNESLLSSTTAGIALVRYPEGVFIQVNRALLEILGYSRESDLIGSPTRNILFSGATYESIKDLYVLTCTKGHAEARGLAYKRADGITVYLDVSVGILREEKRKQAVLTWTVINVTDQRGLAQELAYQAIHDALTGLPNRRALDEEMEKAMARALRHKRLLAVAILDLDGFKSVNDTFGHETGDDVLRTVAHRLREAVRKTDFVARFGGDEFVLILEGFVGMDELEVVFAKIENAVQSPIFLPKQETDVTVGLSMGVSLYPLADGTGSEALLRCADHALYHSKAHKEKRSRYWSLYGEVMPQCRHLHQALLAQGEVDVLYQPILDNRSGRIVGIEALARLRGADGSLFNPAEFLPHLTTEDNMDLSRQVFSQALADLARLDAQGWSLWISFNVAPESFHNHCISYLQGIMATSGIDPSRITVEILESSDFLERDVALSVMHDIKKMGMRLALDDIGSAYASLLRLKELPIDEIKLDQGFVRTLEERPQDLHFVRVIQDLAAELEVDLVAEGVESADILDAMRTMGVPYLQGYAISRPLAFADLQRFLSDHESGDQELSTGLFGFYAGTLIFHSAIKKMLLINPAELNREILPDARLCRRHGILHRLGYDDRSRLMDLHGAYHWALGKVVNHSTESFSLNGPEWDAMETAYAGFMEAILVELKSRHPKPGLGLPTGYLPVIADPN